MITLSNSILTANIKSLGAELCSLTDQNNKEYIWEGNLNFWGKHSPILFPIVGTLKNNCYHHDGKTYNLTRHGFSREMEFEIINKIQNSVTFSLRSSKETLKLFPFDFELQLIYTIVDASLIIEYKVINNGVNKMPFAIGAHPAFAVPNKFKNYSLAFEKEELLEYHLLENDLISDVTKKIVLHEKQVALNYTLFENDALIFKKLRSNSVTILENQKPFLKVNFEDFPSLGIWTKVNAPFICIEPWYGFSDTINSTGNLFDKEGIQILNAAETFNSKFSIEILN
jgi:galactose mutarotase-like enzyme